MPRRARHKAALQPVSELRSAQCSRHNGALLVQPFDTLKTRKVSLWGDMAKDKWTRPVHALVSRVISLGKLPRFGVKCPGLEVEDSGERAAIILAIPNPRSTL